MNTWIAPALDFLPSSAGHGYAPATALATEPTALAALALAAHGRWEAARAQADKLQSWQAASGSLGVTVTEAEPQWPTSLAVIAWHRGTDRPTEHDRHSKKALNWLLRQKGEVIPPNGNNNIGHNTMLVGWPWVLGTHSWLEPTAFALMALRVSGQANHPRAREAAQLLTDRLLPEGGCNYGNTFILGQELRPHVQPTGLVLLALAGETIDDPRIGFSLDFLHRELLRQHSAASFAYAALALAAWQGTSHAVPLPAFETHLGGLAHKAIADRNAQRMALLLLAVRGAQAPLNPAAQPIASNEDTDVAAQNAAGKGTP